MSGHASYTAEDVEKITERIVEVTGGRFRAPYVSRPGDRENFVDTNRIVSHNGARQASAYYLGILAVLSPGDVYQGPFGGHLMGLNSETEGEAFARGVEDARYYQ